MSITMRRSVGVLTAAVLGAATLAVPNTAAAAPGPTGAGELHLVTPTRIVDTRIGLGHQGPLGPDEMIPVDPRESVPVVGGLVNAYVVNVTVVDPTAPGNIELVPWTGPVVPESRSSDVNFAPGRTVANLATQQAIIQDMRLGLINRSTGRSQVVVDVVGYYSYGSAPQSPGMAATAPSFLSGRVLDTRTTQRVPAGGSVRVPVSAAGPVVGTAVGNLTVVDAAAPGHLTTDPADTTSVLNFQTGDTNANSVYLPIATDGTVTLYNRSTGSVDLLLDLEKGFYRDDAPRAGATPLFPGRFHTVPSQRLLDTRIGLGASGPVAADGSVSVTVPGLPDGTTAVVVNLTATEATAPGAVTAFDAGTAEPGTSNVNVTPGRSVANLAVVPVGADGTITLHSHNVGQVQLIVDAVGAYIGA